MKKVLIGLAAAVTLAVLVKKAKDKKAATATGSGSIPRSPATPRLTVEDILAKNDDKIIVDSNGYWIYVKDKKMFTTSPEGWTKYANAHPGFVPEKITQDLWKAYQGTPYIGTGGI